MSVSEELNEFDIEKAFAESLKDCASEKKETRKCYPYSTFNACRSQGSIYGKIIPAMSKGRLSIYKTLNNVTFGMVPFKRDDGNGDYFRTVRVVEASEYECDLTDEQKELNINLLAEIDKYNQLMTTKGGMKYDPFKKKRITIFFMMIRRYVDLDKKKTDYPDPNVTCVYHQSFRFGEKFDAAVKHRSEAMESTAWLSKYFGRKPGKVDNFTIIETKRPDFAYEMNFTFEELPAIEFEAKEDDIKTAESLDEAFVNTLAYDTEFYKEIYERLKELNAELDKGPKIIDAPEIDRTNHNAE